MAAEMTFLQAVIKSIKKVSRYDQEDETAPVAILWTDGEREWEGLLPRLRHQLPLLTLGPYAREERSGPPAWIRCMLARSLQDRIAPATIPVVYLPGIAQEVLLDPTQRRAEGLEPLTELVYRSVRWCRSDGGAWTVSEFFQNEAEGLGVAVRDDDYTRRAMLRVLPALCDLSLSRLQEEGIWKVRDFEALESGGIEELIHSGESTMLEFKSSLQWDMKQNCQNDLLSHAVIKTVAGFLNSDRGGTLLIGVEDNHNVCGIEMDYQTFSLPEKCNPDVYEQHLMNRLTEAIGKEFSAQIYASFHPVNGRTVCKVSVDPAPEPVFAVLKTSKNQREEHFFIRMGNATRSLQVREAINYYKVRWGRKG